ncbi:NAD-dependent dehydratase [Grimontia sp. AD028]|uniref:UDP-glucose 4-epimerase family protein n=1 Tax=Grimontia sp. AD028 TaxID=1581149 RepID=UPI00061AD0AC|nr:SDR family oxidoreductase [Grimontia sp. AD028]KKD61329.1 NAD-dependent dehydratase [Grimontia sp. AD028]
MNIFVTGGSGFVGRRVVEAGKSLGWQCTYQSRSETINLESQFVTSINGDTDWFPALTGVEVLVHCAARVHQMTESQSPEDVLASYQEVNTLGTLNLARQAAQSGVKRFVFISSIKVNGERTKKGGAFEPILAEPPTDPYGLSKYEAEVGLKSVAAETGMEVVIIRPPLVYGPGVKANFESMMKLMRKGIPLPFGAINNQRSLVFIDNLVSLILTCCKHPNAANKIFLVSDNDDVSTTRLMQQIADSMASSSRLVPIPQSLIEVSAKVLGKSHLSDRLCGNLQLDVTETLNTLSWKPPVTFEKGIQETVSAFLSDK